MSFQAQGTTMIKGLVGVSPLGGAAKIASAIGGVLGIGNTNTNPEARALADSTATSGNIRLGSNSKIPYYRQLGITEKENAEILAAAPEIGTFYLTAIDGKIYQSKAEGFFLVNKSWAQKRTADFLRVTTRGNGSAKQASIGLLGAGLVVLLLLSRR